MSERGGTYALLLELEKAAEISVGQLGTFLFPAGYYVYVGSALGGGGLAARLARHLRRGKKLHWHIDYFLAYACLVDIVSNDSEQELECSWARKILSMPRVQAAVPHFGASDCRCPAHLLYLGPHQPPDLDKWLHMQPLDEPSRRTYPKPRVD